VHQVGHLPRRDSKLTANFQNWFIAWQNNSSSSGELPLWRITQLHYYLTGNHLIVF